MQVDGMMLVYQPVDRDPGSTAFADALREVASKTADLRLVSPYLGFGVLRPLTEGRRFRLVTDLGACFEAGADDQLVNFLSDNVDSIRDSPGVHAKVVLGPERALIGSANLTRQAICNRLEMACLVRGERALGELEAWFDELWNAANVVEASELRDLQQVASAAVAARRSSSPRLTSRLRARHGALGWLAPHSGEEPRRETVGGTASKRWSPVDVPEIDLLAKEVARLSGSRSEALMMLRTLAEALEVTGLDVDDERLHLNFGNRRVSITVGQRFVSWFGPSRRLGGSREYMGFLLDDFDVAERVTRRLPGSDSDAFTRAGKPDVPSLYVPIERVADLPDEARSSWHRGIRAEVERAGKSSYRAKKRRGLYFILTSTDAFLETARRAFPKGWWFGVNNGSRGHMQLAAVLPLLRGQVETLEWPVGHSKPRAAYAEMLPGDPILVWTGHGEDPRWGLLGRAVLLEVRKDHVVLGEGEAFPQPLTPYPKGQPMETGTVRFLRDQLGADFAPLGDVLRAVFSTPRRHPVTVAPVPPEVVEAIVARGQGD